jgi:hypothetical protein
MGHPDFVVVRANASRVLWLKGADGVRWMASVQVLRLRSSQSARPFDCAQGQDDDVEGSLKENFASRRFDRHQNDALS